MLMLLVWTLGCVLFQLLCCQAQGNVGVSKLPYLPAGTLQTRLIPVADVSPTWSFGSGGTAW